MDALSRRSAREQAFLLVFEHRFHPGDSREEIYENAVVYREMADDEYAKSLYYGVVDNLCEIDNVITTHSKGWKIERISKVSLAALRIAIYEMLYEKSVSVAVAINEAVEIMKRYESKDASAYVNGLLGSFAKERPELDELKK